MEQTKQQPRKIHRWIFLLIFVGSIFSCVVFSPIMPHIQLPAEAVYPQEGHAPLFMLGDQGFYITNTMIATWLAIILILIVAWNIRKQLKRGDMVLSGVSGAIAGLLEGFYNMTESTAGKWAKKIFPWFATIFLLVLFVNLMELFPFVDSVGYLHESEHGYPTETVLGMTTIVKPDASEEAHGDEHAEDSHGYALVPFVRVASTDLNFTLSLALISVVMTQVIGVQTLGREYWVKYWNGGDVAKSFKQVRFGNPMDFIIGLMKWAASLLEIVAEIAKILSFTFRLFGVIFAGSVLLFFVGSMTGGLGQSGVILLELLFGPLQALVFGMLTMMFMSLATISHAHGDEEGHH